MVLVLAGLFSGLLAESCGGDEQGWERFNASSDAVEVQVTSSPDLGDDVFVDLHSSTGTIVVGTASVSPGSGPVGTAHQLLVTVGDEYQDVVGRVTVAADAGDRGSETFVLVQDSADDGLWVVSMTSSGVEGEVRTDSLRFNLFEPVEGATADTAETAE